MKRSLGRIWSLLVSSIARKGERIFFRKFQDFQNLLSGGGGAATKNWVVDQVCSEETMLQFYIWLHSRTQKLDLFHQVSKQGCGFVSDYTLEHKNWIVWSSVLWGNEAAVSSLTTHSNTTNWNIWSSACGEETTLRFAFWHARTQKIELFDRVCADEISLRFRLLLDQTIQFLCSSV